MAQGYYPFDFKPVSPCRDWGGRVEEMSESHLQATAEKQPPLAMTVPQVRSLGLTGKGKIPSSKCLG